MMLRLEFCLHRCLPHPEATLQVGELLKMVLVGLRMVVSCEL